MSYLTDEEKQQLTFDWRYRGFSTIQLLTEEECEEINTELEQLRTNRFYNKDTGNEWGEYDPFMYPHKLSDKLAKLLMKQINPSCEKEYKSLSKGDPIGSLGTTQKIENLLKINLDNFLTIEKGLARTVNFISSQ